jgi:triosephosphate isomerase (TIM)
MKRTKLIIGNWKMHGSRACTRTLLNALKKKSFAPHVKMAVLPPYVFLKQTQTMLRSSEISWGAQNLSEFIQGAYTGEISATMLAELGCLYVLCGHSERRHLFHEDERTIHLKFNIAHTHDLIPILCVGETLAQKEQGQTYSVLQKQLEPLLTLTPEFSKQVVLAYEPVWAIGSGLSADHKSVQMIHAWLRQQIKDVNPELAKKIMILYGGSVRAHNAKQLFTGSDVDGALIGNASLDAQEFSEIYALAVSQFTSE